MTTRAIFYLFSTLALIGGLALLFTERMMRAVLWFFASLFAVAGLFVLLRADFLAVLQVLIYIGGIAILLAFGLMLTGGGDIGEAKAGRGRALAALAGSGAAAALLVSVARLAEWPPFIQAKAAAGREGTSRLIGELFLRENVFAFELASVLLLAVLIGVALMVHKGRELK